MILKDADKVKELLEEKLSDETERVFLKAVEAVDEAPTMNEWHYPSKGEYPKEDEEDELVLCLQCDGIIPFIGIYNNNKWFNWHTKFNYEFEPKCWQYIEPSKEKV